MNYSTTLKNIVATFGIKNMKLLFIDIETNLGLYEGWSAGYEKTISHDQIILERSIMSIQYKYLGDDKVRVLKCSMPSAQLKRDIKKLVKGSKDIPPYNKESAIKMLLACAHSDKKILAEIEPLINQADYVIAQNGDRFDIRWINARLWYHGLPPISNVITLDTLKLARQAFNLQSFKLDYMAKFKSFGGKVSTKYSMWQDVLYGDVKTLSDLCDVYGSHDINLLEAIFLEMLPYCKHSKLHFGVLKTGDRDSCPACGSKAMIRYGTVTTRAGKKQKWRCKVDDCLYIWNDSRLKVNTDKLEVGND